MTDLTKIKPRTKLAHKMGHFTFDPQKVRPGEKIGGGFIVARRGGNTSRLRLAEFPYEHPTRESAMAERDKLSARDPSHVFCVLAVLS